MDRKHADEPAAARQYVIDCGLEHVKVGVFDMDGVLRGKYLSRDKFLGALEAGFGVRDRGLARDSGDRLFDNVNPTDRELARYFEII